MDYVRGAHIEQSWVKGQLTAACMNNCSGTCQPCVARPSLCCTSRLQTAEPMG